MKIKINHGDIFWGGGKKTENTTHLKVSRGRP